MTKASSLSTTTVRSVPNFDPSSQPSRSAGQGLPIVTEQVLEQRLHRAFALPHQWHEDPLVDEWNQRVASRHQEFRASGVLIGLMRREGQLQVLFTKRSQHLKHHRGQVSFPGGRIEPGDRDVQDAALRETHEEVGVAPDQVKVFGQLPLFYTGTGFSMQPFIGWLDDDCTLVADTNEVEEIFFVPLAFLTDPNNYRLYTVANERPLLHHYYGLHWQGQFIWGATASVLRNLYQCLAQCDE